MKIQISEAILLPNLGMNLFQVKAILQGKEKKTKFDILYAPAINKLKTLYKNLGGEVSFRYGSALLFPFANRLTVSSNMHTIVSRKMNPNFTSPDKKKPMFIHGLVYDKPFTLSPSLSPRYSPLFSPLHHALFHSTDKRLAIDECCKLKNSSIIKAEILIDANSSATAAWKFLGFFDRTQTAKNKLLLTVEVSINKAGELFYNLQVENISVGKAKSTIAIPVSFGLHPYFKINKDSYLKFKSTNKIEFDRNMLPTGKLLPTKNTPFDFSKKNGQALHGLALDDCFLNIDENNKIKTNTIKTNKIEATLFDKKNGYALNIVADTSHPDSKVRALQVYKPQNAKFVAIEPVFNLPDPFNKNIWNKKNSFCAGNETGMIDLPPGDSISYNIKMSISSI